MGKRGFALLDLEKSNASMGLEAAKRPKDFKKLRLFMGRKISTFKVMDNLTNCWLLQK